MACKWILQVFLVCYIHATPSADKVWSQCNKTTGKDCECGATLHDAILCSDHSLQIQPCYCMYYDTDTNMTTAGICMFTCFSRGPKYYKNLSRYSLQNASQLNIDMCGSEMTLEEGINREGRFCGKCKRGYGLAVYSYHYVSCIPCENYSYKNWMKYFAVALVPLTAFYIIVLLLKIDFTSSRLNGRVFAIQCILSPIQMRVLEAEISLSLTSSFKQVAYTLFSFVGILNLDFFRTVYPQFCLHQNINIVQVFTLDFIVALYPFFLIFLTYVMLNMYDRNYRLLVWAWQPFKCTLGRWWTGSDVKGSLIQTFASFILLSSVRILSVCYDLLIPSLSRDATGAVLSTKYLYYDATIEYFGPEHWPYAIIALCIGFVFVLLPFLLLVLYPCKFFQKVLNSLKWRCQALHIFMDAFQGSYRTEPHDLRYFSAYYLLLRVLVLLITSHTATIYYILLIIFVLLISAIVFSFFEPYKDPWSNEVDTIILLSMVLLYTAYLSDYFSIFLDRYFSTVSKTVFASATAFCTFLAITPAFSFLVRLFKLQKVCGSLLTLYKSERETLLQSFDRV